MTRCEMNIIIIRSLSLQWRTDQISARASALVNLCFSYLTNLLIFCISEDIHRSLAHIWLIRDNQNQFLLRLPRRLHLPSDLNQTDASRVIQTRQSCIKIKSRNLYISRVTSIKPYISRGTKTKPS